MSKNEEGSEDIPEGYARVSSILKPWGNWEYLPEKSKDAAERKRRIGIRAHDAIHMYLQCIPVTFGADDEERAAEQYFNSAIKWLRQIRVEVLEDELRLNDHDLKISGGIDALVRIPDDPQLILVDWKAASTYNPKIALSWALQGTFYTDLLRKNEFKTGNRLLFLQLDPDGDLPSVREYTYTKALHEDAMKLLDAYRVYNPI